MNCQNDDSKKVLTILHCIMSKGIEPDSQTLSIQSTNTLVILNLLFNHLIVKNSSSKLAFYWLKKG